MTEYAEHKEKTIELMRPNLTVMDLNIAAALYFATQWIGSRQLNTQKGFLGTSVTYRTPAQVRYPLLDRRVIDLLSGLPVHLKCDHGLGKGFGDSLLLRGLANGLRLVESCTLPKQAIQFGAQSARLDENSKGQFHSNYNRERVQA
ncbi:hypothetical protein PPACK8108_LOCUS12557 [Phakopsora pachyrhizi]|uniref:Uncharacterized protein n=1 Tax=Phakopsora pachyrhizi TaxID=170000 RepID=A0AAV0B4I2_PHAPC|nr:hypothetical protein PPACK8108_LOCUS12557 [Phakopsora pachyrhizi]